MGSEEQKIAEITLEGGKSSGKYQNLLNIKNTGDNSKSSIVWKVRKIWATYK